MQHNSQEGFWIFKGDGISTQSQPKAPKTSKNPVSLIAAWHSALNLRGIIDQNNFLTSFAAKLERALSETITVDKILAHYYFATLRLAPKLYKDFKNVSDTEFINVVQDKLYTIIA